MAITPKIANTIQLPCLVCSINGLYSKKSNVLPSQKTNGKNVHAKVVRAVMINRICFFHPIHKNSYPYMTHKGMTAIRRVDSINPTKIPIENMC